MYVRSYVHVAIGTIELRQRRGVDANGGRHICRCNVAAVCRDQNKTARTNSLHIYITYDSITQKIKQPNRDVSVMQRELQLLMMSNV